MNDWFDWKDHRCTDFGIHVSEQPAITLPSERVTFTDIPGRSGSLTITEGESVYDDLIISVECFIENDSRLHEITGWLRGSGHVTLANRPDGYYEARVINQIPFQKILRGSNYRSFVVNFRCKPFFHLNANAPITMTESGNFVLNSNGLASRPKITVVGNGDITLIVGMEIIELSGIEESITIDSDLMECYRGDASCNSQMTGNFPLL